MNRRRALPDGRAVRLDDGLPACCGPASLVVDGVAVREAPAVWDETASLAERLRALHAGQVPSDIPGLREARDLYKRLRHGTDAATGRAARPCCGAS